MTLEKKQDRPEMALMETRLFGIYFKASPLGSFLSGRCEKLIFNCGDNWARKKTAPECPRSDRRGVGIHLGSKLKSRKLRQINFLTSSCPAFVPRAATPNLGYQASFHSRLDFR
jgi:hypothetical protein